jgi:hypothetical protein
VTRKVQETGAFAGCGSFRRSLPDLPDGVCRMKAKFAAWAPHLGWQRSVFAYRLWRKLACLRTPGHGGTIPRSLRLCGRSPRSGSRRTSRSWSSFGTRLTLSAQDPGSDWEGPRHWRGAGMDQVGIRAIFERLRRMPGSEDGQLHGSPRTAFRKRPEITNVYAVLKGSRSGEREAHRAGDGALRFAQ